MLRGAAKGPQRAFEFENDFVSAAVATATFSNFSPRAPQGASCGAALRQGHRRVACVCLWWKGAVERRRQTLVRGALAEAMARDRHVPRRNAFVIVPRRFLPIFWHLPPEATCVHTGMATATPLARFRRKRARVVRRKSNGPPLEDFF